ncbi:MAG: nitroreductase [Clostridia bacterium]|nr:nitroreductase [Clostridia bacterium]
MNSEILNGIKERRSIRKYKAEQIKDCELDAVLEAATYAPTGRNLQAPKMVVVQDKETIEVMRKINAEVMGSPDIDPFYGAPTVVVVFTDKNVSTHLEDGSLVLGAMMLAAHAVGLGSCWIHRARETFETETGKELMKKWGIGENYVGVGNCILGYADCEMPEARPRKSDYILKV